MQALIRLLQSEASKTLRRKHKRTSPSLLICGVKACGKSVFTVDRRDYAHATVKLGGKETIRCMKTDLKD